MVVVAGSGQVGRKIGGAFPLGYNDSTLLLVATAYALAHAAIRLVASGNLGEDDPATLIAAQDLMLVYPGRLPLYTWVVHGAVQLLGPSLLPFLLLKYTALVASVWLTYRVALRLVNGDVVWAFLAAESIVLIYQISWRFHEGFTDPIGAMVMVMALLLALIRLVERPSFWRAALMGGALGLCTLTVPMAWLFVVSLGMAAIRQRSIRSVLPLSKMALAIGVAAAVSGWPLVAAIASGAAGKIQHFHATALISAFREPLLYVSPLIIILPFAFRGFVRNVGAGITQSMEAKPDWGKLLQHQSGFAVAGLVAGAGLGAQTYPTHALMPLFLPALPWLVSMARTGATRTEIRRYAALLIAITAIAFAARSANLFIQQPVCKLCRWGLPYDGLAAALATKGISANTTLIVADAELGGNLRRFFPAARVQLAYAGLQPARPWLAVWADDRRRRADGNTIAAAVGPGPEQAPLIIPWAARPMHPAGRHVSRWRIRTHQ